MLVRSLKALCASMKQCDPAGNHFPDFRHYDSRLEALEAKQRKVYKAILDYIEADINTTWLSSAKDLREALLNALKETQ